MIEFSEVRMTRNLDVIYLICVISCFLLRCYTTPMEGQGCYYKGQFYLGGWEDGCDFRCQCLNPSTGHYRCNKRCPHETKAPSGCSLQPSLRDECCSDVICPQTDSIIATMSTISPHKSQAASSTTTPTTSTYANFASESEKQINDFANDIISNGSEIGGSSDDYIYENIQEVQIPTSADMAVFENDGNTDNRLKNLTQFVASISQLQEIAHEITPNASQDGQFNGFNNNERANGNDDDSNGVADIPVTLAIIQDDVSNTMNSSFDILISITTTMATPHIDQSKRFGGVLTEKQDEQQSNYNRTEPLPDMVGSNHSNLIGGTYSHFSNYLNHEMPFRENISFQMRYNFTQTPNTFGQDNKTTHEPQEFRLFTNNIETITNDAPSHNGTSKRKRQYLDLKSLKVSKSSTERFVEKRTGLGKTILKTLEHISWLSRQDKSKSRPSSPVEYMITSEAETSVRDIKENTPMQRDKIYDRQKRLRQTLTDSLPYTYSPQENINNSHSISGNKQVSLQDDIPAYLTSEARATLNASSNPEENTTTGAIARNRLLLLLGSPHIRQRRLIFHMLKQNKDAVLELKRGHNATDQNHVRNDKTIFTASGVVKLKAGDSPNVQIGALMPAGSLLRRTTTSRPMLEMPKQMSKGKCHYKDNSYDTGQIWYDGCKSKCICIDGHKNALTCKRRCRIFTAVPPHCSLVVDVADRCCLLLYCNHQVTNTEVPASTNANKLDNRQTSFTDTGQRNETDDKSKSANQVTSNTSVNHDIRPDVTSGVSANEVVKPREGVHDMLRIVNRNSAILKSENPNTLRSVMLSSTHGTHGASVIDTNNSGSVEAIASVNADLRLSDQTAQAGNHEITSNSTLSKGCDVNGHVYKMGDSWTNGCRFRCFCTDDTTMMIACVHLCVRWTLPPDCTFDPPPPGKCCEVPKCPPGYKIRYPRGYRPE